MLTFTSLSHLTDIERKVAEIATFVAEIETATMSVRTQRDRQISLDAEYTAAAKYAITRRALAFVDAYLAEAADLGVDVAAERKAWAQKRTQLLPLGDIPLNPTRTPNEPA